MDKPLIGIAPSYKYDEQQILINKNYVQAILYSGGIPFILPVLFKDHLLDLYVNKLDGFILSGGPDVDAKYFNQNNLQFSGEISPIRDEFEIQLVKKLISNNKPILGICRGIQVINIAAGGDIYQDLKNELKSDIPIMHSQKAPKWHPIHKITIQPNTKVWSSFHQSEIYVNSFHHQAVKNLADDFIISSTSPDGIIESIEHKHCNFIVGVQWHPELMWSKNAIFLGIFKLLVDSCINN